MSDNCLNGRPAGENALLTAKGHRLTVSNGYRSMFSWRIMKVQWASNFVGRTAASLPPSHKTVIYNTILHNALLTTSTAYHCSVMCRPPASGGLRIPDPLLGLYFWYSWRTVPHIPLTKPHVTPRSAPFRRGFGSPSSTVFFVDFSRVYVPNSISIGPAILAQLALVTICTQTDTPTQRQTDRPRHNGNNKPHLLLRIAMRPKMNKTYERTTRMS